MPAQLLIQPISGLARTISGAKILGVLESKWAGKMQETYGNESVREAVKQAYSAPTLIQEFVPYQSFQKLATGETSLREIAVKAISGN